MNETINFKMNLYLITQSENNGYDTYDSAVVAAKSEDDARLMHPANHVYKIWSDSKSGWYTENSTYDSRDWAAPKHVKVELVGKTDKYNEPTVVVASFNAG